MVLHETLHFCLFFLCLHHHIKPPHRDAAFKVYKQENVNNAFNMKLCPRRSY